MKCFSFFLILTIISSILSIPTLKSIRPNQALFGAGEPEFVIVIPSYNNEKWARENLHSACTQKSSRPYQVICVNDCSPDRTGEIMESYVRENHLESMVTIIHNKERLGAMRNWYNTIHTHIPDHKVVVNLDGDDLLAHDKVLLTLEKYYKDPSVWLTYGSALAYPSGDRLWYMSSPIPESIFKNNTLRTYHFISQHLRTFKAGLFKMIKKEDLMVQDADLILDMAFMFPMIEMCSPPQACLVNHTRFIPEILYLYRTNNPLNLVRTHAQKQIEAAKRIVLMKPYESLDEKFYTHYPSLLRRFMASKYEH